MSDDPNEPMAQVHAPQGARFAIVWSRFNHPVVSKLLEGAKACFSEHGVADDSLYVIEVPGAWELPYAAQQLAQSKRFDAVVTLGAVIRGGTPHFYYVCQGKPSAVPSPTSSSCGVPPPGTAPRVPLASSRLPGTG